MLLLIGTLIVVGLVVLFTGHGSWVLLLGLIIAAGEEYLRFERNAATERVRRARRQDEERHPDRH